jgi:hypothetical protein
LPADISLPNPRSASFAKQQKWPSQTYSSPNNHPAGDLHNALVRHLQHDAIVFDLLDHGFCQNFDLGLSEGGFCVFNELFGKHGQDRGKGFDKRYADFAGKFRVPAFEVILL